MGRVTQVTGIGSALLCFWYDLINCEFSFVVNFRYSNQDDTEVWIKGESEF